MLMTRHSTCCMSYQGFPLIRHHSCVLVKNGEFHKAKSAGFSSFRPNSWIVLQWHCHRWDRGLHVPSMQFLELGCLIKGFPWWGIILAFWSKMVSSTRQNLLLSRIFDQTAELCCNDIVIDEIGDCMSHQCNSLKLHVLSRLFLDEASFLRFGQKWRASRGKIGHFLEFSTKEVN